MSERQRQGRKGESEEETKGIFDSRGQEAKLPDTVNWHRGEVSVCAEDGLPSTKAEDSPGGLGFGTM